jgi:ABC-type polysaccharide/polyol phosphate export permease
MPGQLRTIWRFRHFWLALAANDLRVRYRRSVLGIGWSLLNPIVMTIVFCVAFASLLGNGDWRTAAPFYLTGLAIWEFVKQSAVQGSQTFHRNESYIRQSPLPLAVYTLRTSLGTTTHFLITISVAILATCVLHRSDHFTPLYTLWTVLPAILMLIVFCWAVTAMFAIANVFFHDVQHLAELGFGICFFLTPIIYTKDRLIERGLGIVADLNPVVAFFDVIRDPLLGGEPPSVGAVCRAFAATLMTLFAAGACVCTLQRRVIFHL